MYGCRVVQKAMEKVDDEDLIDLLSEFHDTVLNCIHDQNGNHVIQKIIPVISSRSKTYQAEDKEKAINFSKQLNFVLDCVIENIVPLSCHPFGCRVLQRILEHCIESQKSRALDAIQRCLRILLDDQYGNYVIQHVLQFGRKSDRDVVLQIVIENGILGLSRQKFASNVIEKLLKYGNGSHRNQVVREMLKVVDDRTVENGRCSIALLMVRDAYANYVVQTTLNVVPEGEEKELLLQDLRNNSAQLVSLYLSLIFLNLF
jgi:pumilio RNA-binding family